MSNILLANSHTTNHKSLCGDLHKIGFGVYLPRDENFFGYGALFPNFSFAHYVNFKELNSSPIDVIFCGCFEQLGSSLKLRHLLQKPLVLLAGNNNVKYTSDHSDYLLSRDIRTYELSNVKHKLFYMPAPDYQSLTPTKPHPTKNIVSLISSYPSLWPAQHAQYLKLQAGFPNLNFVNYTALSPEEVKAKIIDSNFLLHLKGSEGYGWAMLEALALGRPVFVNAELPKNRTCQKFLLHGVNSFHIDESRLLESFAEGLRLLPVLQKDQGKTVREIVHQKNYLERVKTFLQFVIKDSKEKRY